MRLRQDIEGTVKIDLDNKEHRKVLNVGDSSSDSFNTDEFSSEMSDDQKNSSDSDGEDYDIQYYKRRR